jgi:acyl carrier protein
MPDVDQDAAAWARLARVIADAADAAPADVSVSTRLVEDLNLDSLALLEVVVSLLVDFDVAELPAEFEKASWQGVTAGRVYDEVRTRRPPDWSLRWAQKS